MPLLDVRNLRTVFRTEAGLARAVDGVSFSIESGSTVALVGESGCGKSATALSILRLIDDPPGRISEGEVFFDGRDLLALSEAEMRSVRGARVSMVFQEPMTSLNPVFSVGRQVAESLRVHLGASRIEARRRAVELLKIVGIPAPHERVDNYPHELSGGMKQRVVIAMALACNPALLIADEPTTALDVTIQAQILELLASLRHEFEMAVLLITHDLGIVSENADVVNIMYAGKIVERAGAGELLARPHHPYSVGLLNSVPKLGEGRARLETIPGTVPSATRWPPACRFHPRCQRATRECREVEPPFEELSPGRCVACYHPH
ncbi:MAG: ABC transporter ATP-binding protein [Planctomycetota bacterium]